MSKVIHLDEYRLKKDLADVRELISKARHMISMGIEVPKKAVRDLYLWEVELEKRLEDLFSDVD